MSGRRSTTRLSVGERRALGFAVIGLLVVAAAVQIGRADSQRDQAQRQVAVLASAPVPTVTASPAPAPAATVVVTPDPTDAAAAVKPLRDLVAGDRVLYTAEPGGPGVVCVWQLWDQSIATSTIACGDEPPFQTPTGYLTPVETR